MVPRTDEALVEAFRTVRCWERNGTRAPHKPLLLLLALARVQRGEDPWLVYEDVEDQLRALLVAFAPPRKSQHPEYPFWYLKNDGALWTIDDLTTLEAQPRKGNTNVSAATLRKHHARASLAPDVVDALRRRPALTNRIAQVLLENNFPTSLHDDILDAVGMPWVDTRSSERAARDPAFRELILRAYERRCAVCGYDGRLGTSDLGIEAAHVKWHAAGGPDVVENGLALCVFHHKSFDRGAIGLDEQRRVLISQDVHGQNHVEELLLRFVGKPLRAPQSGLSPPALPFIAWHSKEVFRAPPRAA